ESAGFQVQKVHDVLVQRLRQDVPGQLGMLAREFADAGVNIEAVPNDHEHQLILVVDDLVKGRAVSEAWRRRAH
ncbi:MAG TPA: hypothetical protein VK864_20225, partial [Longimicrobiales bacterium]|nr:hypothetical protein [Longimicrobiales bacterium]